MPQKLKGHKMLTSSYSYGLFILLLLCYFKLYIKNQKSYTILTLLQYNKIKDIAKEKIWKLYNLT